MYGLLAAELAPVVLAGVFGLGGVVIGIGGTVVGQMLTRSHAREAWRNDHRLDAYAEFLGSAFAAWNWQARIYSDPRRQAALEESANEELLMMYRSEAKISILGPDTVDKKVAGLHDVIHDMAKLQSSPGGFDNSTPWDEWHQKLPTTSGWRT